LHAISPPSTKRRQRGLNAALLGSVLLPLALFAGVAANDRAETLRLAEANLLATLDTLHGHAQRVFEVQSLALAAVDERLRDLTEEQIRADTLSHHRFLRALQERTGSGLGLVVFDRAGRPLVDSDRPHPPADLDVSDRPYFRAHREDPSSAMLVSLPIRSRAAGGAPTFFVTTRRSSPLGLDDFAGVGAAGVRVATFVEFWARAVPDPDSTVLLFREDGAVLARRTPLPEDGLVLPEGAPVRQAAAAGPRAVVTGVSPLDGVERLLAGRRLERLPVYIGLGVATSTVLAPWRARMAVYGAFATAASLLLGVMALVVRGRTTALAGEVAERVLAEAEVKSLNEDLERRVAERTEQLEAGEARLRMALRAAEESEATLRATIAQAPFPIMLHAEDGEILQASMAWQELSGWRWPEDMATVADWTEHAYGERKDEVRGYIDTLYALGRRVDEGDYRIRTKQNGERVWSFGSAPAGRDARGRRLVVTMAADVTALRRAEGQLRITGERLRLATEGAGVGTWELDLVAGQGTWSDVAVKLIGRDRSTDTAETWPEVAHPDDRAAAFAAWQRAVEEDVLYEAAFRPASPMATARWVISRGWVERDATGEPVRGLGVVLDISALRQTEAELRDLAATLEARVEERTRQLSEVVAELDAFAYSISHDLRAPLRGMEGFARILLEDYAEALGPDGQRYAERIVAAAARMEGLIQDILAYSRLSRDAVDLTPLDLGHMVDRAAAELREGGAPGGAEAEVLVEHPLPRVLGSRPVLGQILSNLLSNAAKFTPPGEHARIRVWSEDRGDRVRLWIEDKGIGLAEEHRDRVFAVFERLHGSEVYPGTGIGLAIVRKGTERLGGATGVESEGHGRGSRFWIELPLAEAGRTGGEA
jgi:PAS domain S-box-containing protein